MEGAEHLEKGRIKELFNKDIFLRLFSVFVAIILWAYVSFVLDPETQKEFTNIPVKFVNEQNLLNSGLTLVNNNYNVSFLVKGRRNIVSSINKERLSAEADLTGYSKLGRNRLSVKISGLPSSVEIIKEPEDIYIELDKAYSIQKNISVITKGEPQKGFAVFQPSVKPTTVLVDGSQRLINSIYDVIVTIDVTNADKSFVTKERISIIDKNGSEIKGLKSSIGIVEVSIPIVKAKEVGLKFEIKGEPAKNTITGNVVLNPSKVLITGRDELLSNVNELNIEALDIRGVDKDITIKSKIVLPSGISIINNDGYVTVNVGVKKIITKNISLNSSGIQIKDKSTNLDYLIISEKVNVILEGLEENINSINSSTLSASINVNNLSQGEYSLPVILNLPEGIKQKNENVLVQVRIKDK